jgi:hypothetical protein
VPPVSSVILAYIISVYQLLLPRAIILSEPKVGKTWENISGSHGDGGARERLRMVTRMVVTGELDSGAWITSSGDHMDGCDGRVGPNV